MPKKPLTPKPINPPAPVDPRRAKMAADISKFKGESATANFKRPVRKILRRHVT